MSEFNLEEFLDNHPKLKVYAGEKCTKKYTIVVLDNYNKVTLSYLTQVKHAYRRNPGRKFYYCEGDIVTELKNEIPADFIRIKGNLSRMLTGGIFLQVLHKSGYYYLATTKEKSWTNKAVRQVIVARLKNKKVLETIGDVSKNYDDFVFEKVGVYKNNEERVKRKVLIIKMLGESNCLNMQ